MLLKKPHFVLFVFSVCITGSFTPVMAEVPNPTINLDRVVHFFTPGGDVVVEVGKYDVEAAEEWLRLTHNPKIFCLCRWRWAKI